MIRVRSLTAADLPLGLRLCGAAGWNQTEADWRRFLDLQPDGCFVAEHDGTPVGTTTTCLFGPVAWIAMVLVEESARSRGVGGELLNHALDFLDRRQIAAIRLDATPLGLPLYQRLGFVEQFQLARYEGVLAEQTPIEASGGRKPPDEETTSPSGGLRPPLAEDGPNASVEQALPEEWEALSALDEAATGTDRQRLLWRLFAEQADMVRVVRDGGRPAGFLTARPGRRAVQLGPCIAAAEAGPLLFADVCRRLAGRRVYLDIPEPNEAATRLAEAHGLTVQRRLMRMCRGVPLCERVERLWASSGPEKG